MTIGNTFNLPHPILSEGSSVFFCPTFVAPHLATLLFSFGVFFHTISLSRTSQVREDVLLTQPGSYRSGGSCPFPRGPMEVASLIDSEGPSREATAVFASPLLSLFRLRLHLV